MARRRLGSDGSASPRLQAEAPADKEDIVTACLEWARQGSLVDNVMVQVEHGAWPAATSLSANVGSPWASRAGGVVGGDSGRVGGVDRPGLPWGPRLPHPDGFTIAAAAAAAPAERSLVAAAAVSLRMPPPPPPPSSSASSLLLCRPSASYPQCCGGRSSSSASIMPCSSASSAGQLKLNTLQGYSLPYRPTGDMATLTRTCRAACSNKVFISHLSV